MYVYNVTMFTTCLDFGSWTYGWFRRQIAAWLQPPWRQCTLFVRSNVKPLCHRMTSVSRMYLVCYVAIVGCSGWVMLCRCKVIPLKVWVLCQCGHTDLCGITYLFSFLQIYACTDNIKTWMTENQLKLNDDKTEALLFPFSSSLKPSTVPLPDSITLGSHNIPFSDSDRNLGFILDSKLSMKKHIIKICQTAYFELKRISSIRRFLTEDATKTLVTSYILSRLDYCNCLLMGTPNSVIQPLQKIQNFAARLVLLAPRHHHATPLLEKTALASHFRTY